MRAPLWILLIFLAFVGLSGCGGGGDKYVGTWDLVGTREMGKLVASTEKASMTVKAKRENGTYPITGWDGKEYYGTIQKMANGEERLVFYIPGPVVELNQGAECFVDPSSNNNLVVMIMPESMVGNNSLVAKNASTAAILEFKKKKQ